MKILLFLIMATPLFAQDFRTQYQLLEGTWASPQIGELTAYFVFTKEGKFTTSLVPEFEYATLSGDMQQQVIRDNMLDDSGFFKILSLEKSTKNAHQATVEIYLYEEYSTNTIEITQQEINIINPDQTKVIFAEKQQ